MAYLSKKNVKWSIETVPAMSTGDYAKLQKVITVSKSIAHSTNSVSTCSSTACVTATHGGFSTLPSLAPLTGQDITEVNVLTPISQHGHMGINTVYGQREQDRKARREIANSNERRRMQSINAGFKSLKSILPQVAGEKLSKAAILQQTAEYIIQLGNEKVKFLTLNERYRSALSECKCDNPKRRSLMSILNGEGLEKDEGIGSPRDEEFEDIGRDSIEIRLQLDRERRTRMHLERKVHELEEQCRMYQLPHSIADSRLVNANVKYASVSPNTHQQDMSSTGKGGECASAGIPGQQTVTFVRDFSPQVIPPPSDPTTLSTPPISLNLAQDPVIDRNPDTTSKVVLPQNKHSASLPRSRQPLKKRAVEMIDSDSPKSKVSRLQIPSTAAEIVSSNVGLATRPVVTSSPAATVLLQHGCTPMLAVAEPLPGSIPVALQSPVIQQDKLVQAAGVINTSLPEHSLLLPGAPTTAPTYITLSPSVTWPDSQAIANPTGYSFALKPKVPVPQTAQSHFVLQPAINRVPTHPEEMTLNQLNAVPSLSMTLTQLNAVPTMTRLSTNGPPALPTTRLQTHYLPVVAMDTVLGQQSERRMSNGTTDSAPSDEDSKSLDEQAQLQTSQIAASAASRRTKSDPGLAPLHINAKEILQRNAAVLAQSSPSVLTSGPGLNRKIDTDATRRNLETIVQAIDHLEQQERRNSQDQQTTNHHFK